MSDVRSNVTEDWTKGKLPVRHFFVRFGLFSKTSSLTCFTVFSTKEHAEAARPLCRVDNGGVGSLSRICQR